MGNLFPILLSQVYTKTTGTLLGYMTERKVMNNRTLNIIFLVMLSLATIAFFFNWFGSATAENNTSVPAEPPTQEDIQFVTYAADASLFEVTMGQYAKFQGSDTVKDLAQLLVTYYTKVNEELMNLAKKRNIEVSNSMS